MSNPHLYLRTNGSKVAVIYDLGSVDSENRIFDVRNKLIQFVTVIPNIQTKEFSKVAYIQQLDNDKMVGDEFIIHSWESSITPKEIDRFIMTKLLDQLELVSKKTRDLSGAHASEFVSKLKEVFKSQGLDSENGIRLLYDSIFALSKEQDYKEDLINLNLKDRLTPLKRDELPTNEVLNSVSHSSKYTRDNELLMVKLMDPTTEISPDYLDELFVKNKCIPLEYLLKLSKVIDFDTRKNQQDPDFLDETQLICLFKTDKVGAKLSRTNQDSEAEILTSFLQRGSQYCLVERDPKLFQFKDFSIIGSGYYDVLQNLQNEDHIPKSLLMIFKNESNSSFPDNLTSDPNNIPISHREYMRIQLNLKESGFGVGVCGYCDLDKVCHFFAVGYDPVYARTLSSYLWILSNMRFEMIKTDSEALNYKSLTGLQKTYASLKIMFKTQFKIKSL